MSAQKRREKGTGTITQMPDGRFRARLHYISNTDGSTREKRKICKTEAEANRTIKAWTKELAQETYIDVKKESVEKFMTNWLVNFKKPDLKPTSYDRLELTLNNHIFPQLGKMQMGAMSADTIQQHLAKLQKDGKSYSTIKKVYDALNACFKWGVAGRKLQYNPMDAVNLPGSSKIKKSNKKKNTKNNIKFFKPDEQDKLIAAAISKYPNGTPIYRFGYAIPLLLNTGLRLGELLALQWNRDVDWENRSLRVDNSIVVIKNRNSDTDAKTVLLAQDSVKSDAGERTVYLNDEAIDALHHLHDLTGNQTYVISTKNNQPAQPSNIERLLRTARKRAGLPDGTNLGPHALRHSFATNLFRQGVDVKVISEILGHADAGVTMNIYMHVMEDQKQAALVKISERKQQQENA